MHVHVLLNSLYELCKRDDMRGLPSILSLFCKVFYNFNNIGARTFVSIYHRALTLLNNFVMKTSIVCHPHASL